MMPSTLNFTSTVCAESSKLQDTIHSSLEQKLTLMQQNYLLQQIRSHHSLNIQKLFPSLLKQLTQHSQSCLCLQNQLSTINSQISIQEKQSSSIILGLSSEITQLQQHLLKLQTESLAKEQYQKGLLLGFIESFEQRIREVLVQKEEKLQERRELIEEKEIMENKIREQKQMIIKLSVTKQKLIEQLNYTQNCQLQPIHMTSQINLKQFTTKFHQFTHQYYHTLTQTITPQYNNLTTQQNISLHQMIQFSSPVHLALSAYNTINTLRKRLNHLAQAKVKTSNDISVEMMKQQLLGREVEEKEEEVKRYQQLVDYVTKQPYCIELLPEKGYQYKQQQTDYFIEQQHNKQVVSLNQLITKVSQQQQQKTSLKNRLTQLTSQLSILKSTHLNLTSLLHQVKSQHQLRTEKLFVSNEILKLNLEEKKIKYQQRLNIKQQSICSKKMQDNSMRSYQVDAQNIQEKQKIFAPIDTNLHHHKNNIQQKISSTYHPQQSPLTQLKARLMAKFQASKVTSS